MTTETILKPIWKGQITIPQSWRKTMWIDGRHVKATFDWKKVIIEPLEYQDTKWDVRAIQLDELNEETIACIKESEKNYKAGNREAFLSFNDVFWDV